jgi:hypothetical protein
VTSSFGGGVAFFLLLIDGLPKRGLKAHRPEIEHQLLQGGCGAKDYLMRG